MIFESDIITNENVFSDNQGYRGNLSRGFGYSPSNPDSEEKRDGRRESEEMAELQACLKVLMNQRFIVIGLISSIFKDLDSLVLVLRK